MEDLLLILILILIIGGASAYVIRAKKRGVKCIGCPSGNKCAKKSNQKGCDGVCCQYSCHCNSSEK